MQPMAPVDLCDLSWSLQNILLIWLRTIKGHTFTSPSVYISFKTIYAANAYNRTVGGAYTSTIISLPASDLSSAVGDFHARVINPTLLAQGSMQVSTVAAPFSLADLNW